MKNPKARKRKRAAAVACTDLLAALWPALKCKKLSEDIWNPTTGEILIPAHRNIRRYLVVKVVRFISAANAKVSDGWPSHTVQIDKPRRGPAIRSTVWFGDYLVNCFSINRPVAGSIVHT